MKDIPLEDFFQAYFDCRKNKRNSLSSLEFELDFESEVIKLYEEVNKSIYSVSPLDVFIKNKPVKREIFAAQFRDRVIHHLIVNKLNNLFEREFIYDSYSCREGKGTLFGIRRINNFMRKCSKNYQEDCWVLKADIKGYFMSINKDILVRKLINFILERYKEEDRERLLWLCKRVIYNNPTNDCLIKSPRIKWQGLPKSKSLFYSNKNCGLPIGNYTNQVFANFYLNSLDHFIKSNLGVKFYGRYVDDFVIFHESKEHIKNIIPKIRSFLSEELKLELHPRKIYLQHYTKGISFLGAFIKPWRIYSSRRIKGSFYKKIQEINNKPNIKESIENNNLASSVNSYLGEMSHFKTYKLRKRLLESFNDSFWNFYKKGIHLRKINLFL
ncbi:MAG: reverse transcriptase/maturase family protein [Candidatus Paceibacterota bacterium]